MRYIVMLTEDPLPSDAIAFPKKILGRTEVECKLTTDKTCLFFPSNNREFEVGGGERENQTESWERQKERFA
jgi:hypothetical protein